MKKGWILVIIVLIGALGGVIWLNHNKVKESQEKLHKLSENIQPFQKEKSTLEKELRSLEKEMDELEKGKGNITLLFRDFDSKMYENVRGILEENNMVGTLIFSEKKYPGTENYITVDQFAKLREKGWRYCLAWNREKKPEQWLKFWEEKLSKLGVERTDSVYFEANSYDKSSKEFLEKNGFNIAVQPAKPQTDSIVEGCAENVWQVYTMGWNDENAKRTMQSVAAGGGAIVFMIGSSSATEKLDTQYFSSMIDTMTGYVKDEKLEIGDLAKARENQVKLSNGVLKKKKEIEEKMEELEKQIEIINDEMGKEYEKYSDEK